MATRQPIVDEILDSFAGEIGKDMERYRNHVYRDLSYFEALYSPRGSIPRPVLIAAAFHDIGIWTDRTFDYLWPSVDRARNYLASRGLESLAPEVEVLILQHHKITPYCGCHANTVEAYRKADLIDVTHGIVRFGLPASLIKDAQDAFPTLGFHLLLARLFAKQLVRSPWRPLPMVRL
jgi:hypothetical protein